MLLHGDRRSQPAVTNGTQLVPSASPVGSTRIRKGRPGKNIEKGNQNNEDHIPLASFQRAPGLSTTIGGLGPQRRPTGILRGRIA